MFSPQYQINYTMLHYFIILSKVQMRTRKGVSILLFLVVLSLQRQPDHFTIDLDLHPKQRYKELAIKKADLINKFIKYLHTTQKYKVAFALAERFSPLLRRLVGSQFYDQCSGIASAIGRKNSELVVFNYMYELGAYNNFCTSIPVQNSQNDFFLARNLDYGYQEYLADNSVILTYAKNSIAIFKTVGHAGLIGAHTGLRFDGYSVTLNERIDGGLHKTLLQILLSRAETVPYLLQKTLRECGNVQEAYRMLSSTQICAPVYFIMNAKNRNIVIERQRKGINAKYENNKFIVQTNTDRGQPDPDTRRDVAQTKMSVLLSNGQMTRQKVWNVLGESPNKNKLTLLTVLLDTSNNSVVARVWD